MMKQDLDIERGFVLTDEGIRLASYGGWRLPNISRASDRLMHGDWHFVPCISLYWIEFKRPSYITSPN